ncbi:enoyl-CoA hydratase/isomerase family protein [Rhodococcoides fascians]|uniref:enoyl-CoA hydratase/isomerase family protein n=1 Tax=Rhodococcoides fascians TaxID=1828 RepID=UPI00068B1641|nr:enoyl-CoA hydratase-related protein [Rhodococcus fascians]
MSSAASLGAPAAASERVSSSRVGAVATITFTNPRRKNALPRAAWPSLRAALADVAVSDARVLVVTGAGEDFCAGAELSGTEEERRPPLVDMTEINEACMALHRLPIPTIARVDGVAVGGGMNLALACDFVVASDRARFSEIFVKRALSVDCGGSWVLPRLIGLHRAKELVLLGEIIGAQQALDWGLIREVVDPHQLDEAVRRLTDRLVAGPPIAMRQSKRMLNDSFETSFECALEDEARSQEINFATDDTAEAGRAFFDKRDPVFRGR